MNTTKKTIDEIRAAVAAGGRYNVTCQEGLRLADHDYDNRPTRPATPDELRQMFREGVTCESFGKLMFCACMCERRNDLAGAAEAAQRALDQVARWGHLDGHTISPRTRERAQAYVDAAKG